MADSMKADPLAVVLLGEIADVLSAHRRLICAPAVDVDDGVLTLRLDISDLGAPHELGERIELIHALRYVADVGQVRGFALRYGIDPQKLEPLLERKED